MSPCNALEKKLFVISLFVEVQKLKKCTKQTGVIISPYIKKTKVKNNVHTEVA